MVRSRSIVSAILLACLPIVAKTESSQTIKKFDAEASIIGLGRIEGGERGNSSYYSQQRLAEFANLWCTNV
jgi:hypothetical protein